MTAETNDLRLPTALDEERFWALLEAACAPLGAEVDQARRALSSRVSDRDEELSLLPVVEGAFEGFLSNLTAAGEGLTGDELTDLDRVAERKLYDIDRADIHAVTDGSDDGFLYARGFVVALGQEFYEAVVSDPQVALLDADCERMCYFFAHLHSNRFGSFPTTNSGISRESFSNPVGWRG